MIVNTSQSEAIIIDPGSALEVRKTLENEKLHLQAILITHHHSDHIDGLAQLKEIYQAPVYTSILNKNLIVADHYISDGQILNLATFTIQSIDLPGHTNGHNAYWFKDENWLFSGDVLFGLGCGRLFEGSFETSYQSLQKIKALPDETQIFCAHEYTELNLNFCKSISSIEKIELKKYEFELHSKKLLKMPSVPLLLSDEKKINPFLTAKNIEDFTQLRILRNDFKK